MDPSGPTVPPDRGTYGVILREGHLRVASLPSSAHSEAPCRLFVSPWHHGLSLSSRWTCADWDNVNSGCKEGYHPAVSTDRDNGTVLHKPSSSGFFCRQYAYLRSQRFPPSRLSSFPGPSPKRYAHLRFSVSMSSCPLPPNEAECETKSQYYDIVVIQLERCVPRR